MRVLLSLILLIVTACGGGGSDEPFKPALAVEVIEYPTCLVLAFKLQKTERAEKVPLAHDANIEGLRVRLPTGESVDVMEQRFFWEEGGGELLVRLGNVSQETETLELKGGFLAFDSVGRPIGARQDVPKSINLYTMKKVLDYKLTASLAPTEDEGTMWLDLDANLVRPLHVSGLPGARIDGLHIEGPKGALDAINSQTFMATASGGKIRVKLPALEAGSRIKLKGWWVPLRTNNTPCCGEQPLPDFVDVAAKDIQER